MQRDAAQFAGVPVLTPAQRCLAVVADTETPAERHLLRPAAGAILFWRPARSLQAVQWFLLSLAFGLMAGAFLLANSASPLFRFWAGISLLGCEILNLAGLQLAGPRAFNSSHAEILRGFIAILTGFFFLLGVTEAAASLTGSLFVWLLGLTTGASILVQAVAFDGAKRQYERAAGGAASGRRETLLEIAVRRQKAVLRGNATEELIWRCYGFVRRMQQQLVPRDPAGSADCFWRLNRRRIAVWAILSRRMNFVWLAAAAIVSAFEPVALFGVFCAITGAGTLLLLFLLAFGWKSRSPRA